MFKPTPYDLTESECDDLDRDFRRRAAIAHSRGETGEGFAWEMATRLLEEARQRSFQARSAARLAKRQKSAA